MTIDSMQKKDESGDPLEVFSSCVLKKVWKPKQMEALCRKSGSKKQNVMQIQSIESSRTLINSIHSKLGSRMCTNDHEIHYSYTSNYNASKQNL